MPTWKAITLKAKDCIDLPTALGLIIFRYHKRGYNEFKIQREEDKVILLLKPRMRKRKEEAETNG